MRIPFTSKARRAGATLELKPWMPVAVMQREADDPAPRPFEEHVRDTITPDREAGYRRLLDAATAPLCGSRSALGFSCDLPELHDGYHASHDPAYPARPHAWRTSDDDPVVSILVPHPVENIEHLRHLVGDALDDLHERKRTFDEGSPERAAIAESADYLAAAWSKLAIARRVLRQAGVEL